ncbi:MAG: DUF4835 family protein [Bacteroidales bacterium]|nr:DUF4835 family protein [Bacteroidales bacterium]
MIIRFIISTLLVFVPFAANAQELRCNVQFTTQQIQGTNKQVFQTLQGAVNEFVNSRAWTSYRFASNERIECSMLFNIQEMIGNDQFRGTLQIQVRRPVYNTSYNTVLMNYIDNDLDFRYTEFEPLEFSETSHLSNLTSILAFYVYVILGLDFDSFALESGNEFFLKAEKIVNNAQNATQRGWRAGESTSRRNRYWLINNILNDDYTPIREFVYIYHRRGLDLMYDRLADGRTNCAESLTLLRDFYLERPDPFMYFLQVILDAKSDEFVNLFQGSMEDEKRRLLAILNQIDPTRGEKYRNILSSEP